MEAPETRYARSGGAYIAYRVVGSGPVDLVLLQGGFSHVELQLDEPSFARFLGRHVRVNAYALTLVTDRYPPFRLAP